MKRTIALLMLLGLVLALAPMPQAAQAQAPGVPITADNAAQVVELARFGRGLVSGVKWSPDGSELMVYGTSGVWLYDTADLTAQPIFLDDYLRQVKSAVYSADGTLIVAANEAGAVGVWDRAAGQQTLTLGLEGNFSHARAAISPDGTRIVMSVGDTLALCDAATGEILIEVEDAHSNAITALAFSPDGSRVASGSTDKSVRLWDGTTLEEVAVMEGHTGSLSDVTFSPDGSLIATGGTSDKMTRLWDGATGAEVAVREQERGYVYSLAYSRDGSTIAIGEGLGGIRLLDGKTLDEQAEWADHHAGDVYSVAFNPDGTRLASVGYDMKVKIWQVPSGEELASVPGYLRSITSVNLNADESLILAGSTNGTVRLWDITGGDAFPVAAIDGAVNSSTENIASAVFSPDGSRFAAIGSSMLRVWDVTATDEPLFEVGSYGYGSFRSLSFSPDGSVIAVTTNKALVLLWDAETGELLNELAGHGGSVSPVVFNRDGSLLISGAYDGTVRVWGLPESAAALGTGPGDVGGDGDDGPDIGGLLGDGSETDLSPDATATPVPPAGALPLTESHTFAGMEFGYPAGWIVTEMEDDEVHSLRIDSTEVAAAKNWEETLDPGEVQLSVNWGSVEEMLPEVDASASPLDMINAVVTVAEMDFGEPYQFMLGDRPAAGADFDLDSVEGTVIVAWIEGDTMLGMLGYAAPGELEKYRATIQAIAGSVKPVPGAVTGPFKLTGPSDCRNVAVSIGDYSSEFGLQGGGYPPSNLLNGDPTHGWSSAGIDDTEYIVVNLDGPQEVIGVLFDSYSPSASYEADSIKGFRIEVPDGEAGTVIFEGEAAYKKGYQVYTFAPVTASSLRFVFTSNYGGDYFEAADLMICAAPGDGSSPPPDDMIQQWAARAEATTQYSDPEWSAAQATGAPDTDGCGDMTTAWASYFSDGVDDLTVYFEKPVVPRQVNIYQTYNPGSIKEVTLIVERGVEYVVPNSADPGTACPGVFSLDIPPDLTNGSPINAVRIHVDQRALGDWNEIDAVQLVGVR